MSTPTPAPKVAQVMPIRTHTLAHTHTHTYIYIYSYTCIAIVFFCVVLANLQNFWEKFSSENRRVPIPGKVTDLLSHDKPGAGSDYDRTIDNVEWIRKRITRKQKHLHISVWILAKFWMKTLHRMGSIYGIYICMDRGIIQYDYRALHFMETKFKCECKREAFAVDFISNSIWYTRDICKI